MFSRALLSVLGRPLASVLIAATIATANAQCYSGVYMILARGTDEPQGGSILETVAAAVEAAVPNSAASEVVYSAITGSGFYGSVADGVNNAQQQMQDYYNQCPTSKMVVMGYSQGALVTSGTMAGTSLGGSYIAPLASNIGDNGESMHFCKQMTSTRLTAFA